MKHNITESELLVMEVLWNQGYLRSGEIALAVAPRRDWHRKTVNTLIRRLVEKGAIDYETAPGGFLYFPIVSKELIRQRSAAKLVNDLFDGEVSPLLAAFAETEKLTKSDLKQLRNLVSRLSK